MFKLEEEIVNNNISYMLYTIDILVFWSINFQLTEEIGSLRYSGNTGW